MSSTLFESYGGFAKISRVVSEFYDKVLDSPILSPYFENVDMKSLIDHQTKFISSLMGGPASYTNQELERIHSYMNIDEDAFLEMAFLLKETLEDFEYKESDIIYIDNEIKNKAKFIISKK
jgi:hemoglobin